MNYRLKILLHTSWIKTVYFNCKSLPLKEACKLPILISKHTRIRSANGTVSLLKRPRFGMFRFGYDNIEIIDNIRNRCVIYNEGKIILGNGSMSEGSKIAVFKDGILKLGDHFGCTASSQFIVKKSINFGNNCMCSWDCLFMDSDFHSIVDKKREINPDSEIIVGDNVWIGARCVILKGTSIASNSIIAANSTIQGNLKLENAIYTGLPLKILKQDISWER